MHDKVVFSVCSRYTAPHMYALPLRVPVMILTLPSTLHTDDQRGKSTNFFSLLFTAQFLVILFVLFVVYI